MHELIADDITHRRSLLASTQHVLRAQNAQLLREERLTHCKLGLQFLDAVLARVQDIEDADPQWMRQRAKEVGFKRLEFAGFGLRHMWILHAARRRVGYAS